jgi:hypothetical protein
MRSETIRWGTLATTGLKSRSRRPGGGVVIPKTFLKLCPPPSINLWNFSLGAYASKALQIADIERILGAVPYRVALARPRTLLILPIRHNYRAFRLIARSR